VHGRVRRGVVDLVKRRVVGARQLERQLILAREGDAEGKAVRAAPNVLLAQSHELRPDQIRYQFVGPEDLGCQLFQRCLLASAIEKPAAGLDARVLLANHHEGPLTVSQLHGRLLGRVFAAAVPRALATLQAPAAEVYREDILDARSLPTHAGTAAANGR